MTGEAKSKRQSTLKNLLLSKNLPVDNAEIERMSRTEIQRKINELKK